MRQELSKLYHEKLDIKLEIRRANNRYDTRWMMELEKKLELVEKRIWDIISKVFNIT